MTNLKLEQEFVLAPLRKIYFILHDYQMDPLPERYMRLDHDPETVPTYFAYPNPVTDKMDGYIRGILNLFAPGLSKDQFDKFWYSLWRGDRAFSNINGAETDHFAIQEILCGGATVEAVTGEPVRLGGRDWIEIHAINIHSIPPIPDRAEDVDMTRHFRPTTFTHKQLADGSYRIGAFPQFDGKTVVPMFSRSDTLFIPAERLKRVVSIHNPFNPPLDP